MTQQNFDPRDFRAALGQFPTGVTVITTRDNDNNPIGVTASSFNTVSMEPQLVLWSVAKSAYSSEIFRSGDHFAVNVLSEQQVDVSNRFASQGEDKFKDVDYTEGAGDCPLFRDCAAQFECKTWQVYEGGDHLIIVGEVLAYHQDQTLAPLVFSQGRYAVTTAHPKL